MSFGMEPIEDKGRMRINIWEVVCVACYVGMLVIYYFIPGDSGMWWVYRVVCGGILGVVCVFSIQFALDNLTADYFRGNGMGEDVPNFPWILKEK